jgi:hypothetical protein
MSRADRHQPFRELLAGRLDEPLERAQDLRLETHLAACAPCRSVAQAYEAQRKALRGLRAPDPPRDLWARTATALDHEVGRRTGAPRLIALGSMASLGLVAAVALGAFGVGPFNIARPGPATPFPVTPQPVAYLTTNGDQITIYQTQVSSICPPSALDCVDPGTPARPVARVDLDASVSPRDLALAADGNLAITARDSLGRAIYSVVTLPGSEATATVSASPTSRPSSRPSPGASGSSGSGASGAPSGPIPSASGADLADATLQPLLSDVIAAGAPAAWSPDGTILAFSARPADGSTGPDVYVWQVGASTVKRLTRDHHSYFASWAGQLIVVSRTPSTAAATAGGKKATPRPSNVAGHASSTPVAPAASPSAAASAIADATMAAATLLLDPATGAARPVALEDAWLPAVDPSGRFVVYWKGTLKADGSSVDLTDGALYIADWSTLTGITPLATATPAPVAPSGSLPGSPTAVPPSPSPSPSASLGHAGPTPPFTGATATAQEPRPSGSAGPAASGASDAPVASATDAVTAYRLWQTGTGVTDWLARWAPDGSAYGIWTADAPGSDSGTLMVVDAGTPTETDLLSPTPAQRAFSLSVGRVTWVAPDTASQPGDLRVVTWGADGAGGVHIPILHGVTLAF